MIGDWLAQAPLFLLAVAVLFVPGVLVGLALRLRGLVLAAAAPGISVALLAVLAIAYPLIGVAWNGVSAGLGVAIIAAVVFGLRMLLGRMRHRGIAPDATAVSGRSLLLLVVGLVVGAALNAARLMTYVGVPTAISQTNDAVFHLNALRWIAETGSASSLDLTSMLGASSFYPAAWHAVASLVAVSESLIPVAANLVALVIVALIWPLGIALLARELSRGDALVTALAAALSAGLLVFPQLMIEWGVLYPYALSLALVPAALALAIRAVRQGILPFFRVEDDTPSPRAGAWTATITALVIVVGILLAQPSSVLVWGLLLLLWLSGEAIAVWRSGHRRRGLLVGVLGAGWALFAGVWAVLAYLAGPVLWKPYRSIVGAGLDVLLNSHSQVPPALALSALMVVGLFAAARQQAWRWLAVAWGVVSFLYVISVATDIRVLKRVLTGPWYGDSFRLASIVPLVVIPLAALGLAVLVRAAAARLRGTTAEDRLSWGALALVALLGAATVAIAPVSLLRVAAETDRYSRYAMTDDTYLSTDEYTLLRALPELVPEDALLIGNPSTGIGFAYVLGQRDVIPRTWSPPVSQAWDELALNMRDAGTDPAVCEALAAYGSPTHVLDFGPGSTGPGQYVMPGMTDFERQPGFELVERRGDASLWEITACE